MAAHSAIYKGQTRAFMRTAIHRKAGFACARALRFALALFAFLFAAHFTFALGEYDGMLRVKLARVGAPSTLTMRANCDYTLAADPAPRIPAGADMTVSAKGGSLTLTVGNRSVKLGASACLRREGSGDAGVAFVSPALSNRFCGDVYLTASEDTVAVVLRIYIEDYLYGVVGNEMSPSSGIEALKAQAIVARNYALQRKLARSGSDYDLSDSGDALSYRGYSDAREYADVIRAVDETRGLLACYGDSPAICYFCDSNGGQTESSANAFETALPYTQVMDDPYDLEGGGAQETAVLRRDASDLNDALRTALIEGAAEALRQQGRASDVARIAAIEDIQPDSPRFDPPSRLYRALDFTLSVAVRDASGEENIVRVTVPIPTYDALEQWYDLSINDGDNETVWVRHNDQAFEIAFRRKGYGVGMSQRGAQAMARKGLTCETILEYYYPGVSLRRETLSDASAQSGGASKAPANTQPIATARLKQKARLYESADSAAPAQTTLPAGASVTVYAVRGEWAAIVSGKLRGFIHTDALTSFALTGVTAAQVQTETYARIGGGPVKMLQLPVSTALTVDTLPEGTLVRMEAYTDKWALVSTASDVEGFIPMSALSPAQQIAPSRSTAIEGGEITPVRGRQYRYVSADDLSLFESYSADSDILATLKAGEKVRVGAYNDKWACVRARGVTGFVLRSGLSAAPPKAAADGVEGGKITVVKGTRYAVVARDDAPMYPTWSESDAPVKRLDKGAQVLLGAYNGAWACVNADGVIGFMRVDALKAPDENK